MKLRFPNYYKDFKCIAERCTDNCCIGWEIDIDSETAEYYSSVSGEFGERLEKNIKDGSFVLCGERCPFLNNKNLCDIFTTLGEEHLCAICTEHPRYYGWYGDIKEGGIGLCCEEAARLILTSDGIGSFEVHIPDEESEEVDDELFAFLIKTRDEIFSFIDSDVSFADAVCAMLDYAETVQYDHIDFADYSVNAVEKGCISEKDADIDSFISAFNDFEPIDDTWTKKLLALGGSIPTFQDKYLKNIFKYFIWRYFLRAVFGGDVLSLVQFAVAGCIMISIMAESDSLGDYINAAKLYSKEIEYSEENTALLLDLCCMSSAFSIDNLKSLVI